MEDGSENTATLVRHQNPPPPPNKRGRGRPKKGEGIDWNEVRTVYITTAITLEKIAEKFHVSKGAVNTRSCKEKWVKQREDHRRRAEQRAIRQAEAKKAKSIADEVEDVNRLTYGVVARLGQKLLAPKTKDVTCPCGCGHTFAVEIPQPNVTVRDLERLVKIRAFLKGDPEFIAKIESQIEAKVLFREMTPEEARSQAEELIRECEAYVLE